MTIKKKIKINGMHCVACAMNIDFDVEDIKGVVACKTSYAKGEAEIEMEEGVDMVLVEKAIVKLGYTTS